MRIGILTYGCAVNQADSETIASILKASGHEVVFDSDAPDLIIVNTCIVKGPTENKIIRRLQDLEKSSKRVIVAGCMPEAYPEIAKRFPRFEFIGTEPESIVGLVGGCNERHKKVRVNPFVEIIPICNGCMGACAYCATKIARGNLKSRGVDEIVETARKALSEGIVEIWLTAQDTGCYGFDIRTNLAEILNKISALDGEFRVRVGMMNPEHALKILDALVEAYKNEKVYKFLHLPVQSGSDRVLKLMLRGYSVKQFIKVSEAFRKKADVAISTDIIVGFPGETEADFNATFDLIKKLKPEVLNISKYWMRRRTAAASMKQLPIDVIKERGKELSELYAKSSSRNINSQSGPAKVLVTEKRGALFVGRTEQYRPVLIESKSNLLGKFINVEVEAVDGKIVAVSSQ